MATILKNKASNAVKMQALVHNAAKFIAPVWPLETFIACNPLQGFEGYTFTDALMQSGFGQTQENHATKLQEVNLQMIKWCVCFFDEGQSSIEMPYRETGFYNAFKKLVVFDKQLHRNNQEIKKFLQILPNSAEETIEICCQKLQVSTKQAEAFIAKTFAYLPGWAGFVKWNTDWRNQVKSDKSRVTLTDFLAVRLVLTCIIWPEALNDLKSNNNEQLIDTTYNKLINNEEVYQKNLLQSILPKLSEEPKSFARKDAQLVFCIDVRSEVFRRAIESLGEYETFGFAGFFGLPIQVKEFDSSNNKACCPVLLKPKYAIKEIATTLDKNFTRYNFGKLILNSFKNIYIQLKYNIATPFALVESVGCWYGLSMAFKTLLPTATNGFFTRFKKWLKPKIPTKLCYELDAHDSYLGLSLQEQIVYAETVLRLMGLISGFAKLIILCGHGSKTANNPYASALDCGACGGNQGGINARLLASILNKPVVRQGLENVGINIPLDTVFHGALHNTTTDDVELCLEEGIKVVYPELLTQLQNDLNSAKQIANQERGVKLSSRVPSQDIKRRSVDWSETRPEWGLARNAAFIVAPRSLTKDIRLDGRSFLHSYRFEQDSEGLLLETILTAPMVVAEWINTQYLFSTLDNVAYGSGSKITQNVVGTIGIMQGNGSDLMHGLPLQSVMSSDNINYHEPQRLLTVIYAPKLLVAKVIDKHSILKTLFLNQWVHLIVIEPSDNLAYKLNSQREWIKYL